MSLESFKRTSLTWNRANDILNKTPIEIVAGDANARTLQLYITNDGYADALTGYDVRLYWSYADASSAGIATFIADQLNQGIYTLMFPTEMTAPGTILANISLENKDEKSVIVSKQITFNVLTSQLNETAVEVTNRIDEFKQLLLTIYPNSVATELSAQKAHPVGSVIINTSSSSSGYAVGTWSSIGSTTVGSTRVYYWKRTG